MDELDAQLIYVDSLYNILWLLDMSVSRDHYYKLASDLESERISSAASLIEELTKSNNNKEWIYALDRLIKGLLSSRASARIGFSMCLGEILSILISEKKQYSVPEYLNDLSVKLQDALPNKNNGKNERSFIFGELFGLQSLLNSGVISKEIENDNFENYSRVLSRLVDLSLKKSWIRETCFATIFKSLTEFDITFKENSVVINLLKKIEELQLSLTTEGLLVCMAIPPNKRDHILGKALINHWKNNNPLSKGNLSLLVKILKESEVITLSSDEKNSRKNNNKKQKGSWSPQIHFIWGPLLNELLENSQVELAKLSAERKSKKQKKQHQQVELITLPEFWKSCIDDQFFNNSASVERKYWGFEIFNTILQFPSLSNSQISSVMSDNLMRTLINQSSKTDRLLNTLAKSVLKSLVLTCQTYPERRKSILNNLINTSLSFDKLTNSKTVHDILQSSDSDESISETIDFLIELEEKVETDLIKYQIFSLDNILQLIRSKKAIISSSSIFSKVLTYLTTHAFTISASQKNKFSDRMSQLSNDRLYSVLSEVMSSNMEFGIHSWPYYALSKIRDLDNSEDSSDSKLRVEFEGELKELKDSSFVTLDTITEMIKNPNQENIQILNCFEVLFSITLLQLYSGDEDSASILADLQLTFADNFAGDEKPDADVLVQTLVDLMLSYMTQKTALMKKLSFLIWDNLMDNISKSELDRLFEVLLTKENKEGQEKLFSTGNEDGEEEAQDRDDDENMDEAVESEMDNDSDESDDKEVDSEGLNGTEYYTSDSNSEGEDDESDNKKKIEEVEKNTSLALSKALGVPLNAGNEDSFDDAKDGDSEDSSEFESDEESMSDEQMMAIDSTLGQIFKQRRDAIDTLEAKSGNQRKQDAANARELMIFFKNRVLDLLEVFNKKRPTVSLNLYIAICLLDLMDLTQDKGLGEKAHKLIKKSSKHALDLKSLEEKQVIELLISIFERAATKSRFHAYSQACNQISILVVKSAVKSFGDEILDQILNTYFSSLKSWAKDKNNKIINGLYFDLINWLNSRRTSESS